MNTELKIEGMTCDHCVNAVKKALEAVPGVQTVEVDLAGGKATVTGAANAAALVEAVDEEGYSAREM